MTVLPPATIAEGVLGKEAYHVWNGFALNVIDGSFPRYKLTDISGLHDKAEGDNNSAPLTARDGEIFYLSASRGKTIVYTGILYAESLPELRVAMNALKAAFASQVPGLCAVVPPAARGGVYWSYFARCLSCTVDEIPDLPESARPTPWQADFIITLRQNIPVYVESTVNSVNSTSSVDVDQQGTAAAYPYIEIGHSAGADVTITNVDTGSFLSFNDLPTGLLKVDFRNRSAICGTSTDAIPYLDDDSTWWDELVPGLIPGNNTITQSGGSSIKVQWQHTSY